MSKQTSTENVNQLRIAPRPHADPIGMANMIF